MNRHRCQRRFAACSRAIVRGLPVLLVVAVLQGCAENSGTESATAPAGKPRDLPPPKIVADAPPPADEVPAEQAAAPPVQLAPPLLEPPPIAPQGPILGKKTEDIRDAKKEIAAGAKKKQPRITGNDPISVSGSAYAAIVGRTEQLRIEATLKYYYAEHQRYPKDLDEFMREIIRPNGIRLTQLPYYQKYAYDADRHQLVILEYPHED